MTVRLHQTVEPADSADVPPTRESPPPFALDPLPPLPDVITARDGQRVDTTAAQWQLTAAADRGATRTLDWSLLDRDLGSWEMPERDREIFRHYVASVIARGTGHTAVNVFKHVRHAIRWYVRTYAGRAPADRVFAWRRLTSDELIALSRAYFGDVDQPFRPKAITRFARWRSASSFEADQRFRWMPITAWGLDTGTAGTG